MPVGRPSPDDDGTIVPASRNYRGRTMGELTVWNCPACGKKNEGRPLQVGCAHCGAGDPVKSRAGTATGPERRAAEPVQRTTARRAATVPPGPPSVEAPGEIRPAKAMAAATGTRILRMVEYLIKPGHNIDEVLRRSLVGRMDLAWGTLTGTIVDSIDQNQEDRLRLAKLQPGVWIANQRAGELAQATAPDTPMPPEVLDTFDEFDRKMRQRLGAHNALQEPLMADDSTPQDLIVPDTGPPYTQEQFNIAQMIYHLGAAKLCYTLALALQNVAQELEGNSEPDKFLSGEECLQFAEAFMQQVPPDWQGDKEEGADG